MTQSWPDFSTRPVVIVASGPSAATVDLAGAKDSASFVAINESWRLCPWASAVYGCDYKWWKSRKGLPEYSGLKISQSSQACSEFALQRVHLSRGVNRLTTDKVSHIGDGGNGGFQALNIVLQLGARTILLIGYDMTLSAGEHWHGRHVKGLNNPSETSLKRWLSSDWSVPNGVKVINCNPSSRLDVYPKMKFEEGLCRTNHHSSSRAWAA